MALYAILLIAIALAMDSFAVSIVNGCTIRNLRVHHVMKVAFCFAVFQALMPLAGYVAGVGFRDYVNSYGHWIAFFILLFVGAKMVYESFSLGSEAQHCPIVREERAHSLRRILLLSFATSIDALAVGVSFSLLNLSIWFPVFIIGLVTFAFSFAGVYIGNRFGRVREEYIERLGGAILIAIGVKILLEHL
ncbi:manganese efflux pump MntP family protein [Desulfurispirillum indicum]|uniref:manganese efflux pump MntP n=1 Tax=Desulfurispirillum indicum TaxID=936456 RepID=UPI001CFA1A0E|nr:manganese efflux pump MntP family protein [Desulfurispirillum indicum]UCZ57975.1 manganese efflux pump MntP family protein [Desulfurispirillum indicum]